MFLNGPASVVVGLVHVLVPFMVLSIASVLRSIDPQIEESARILGANRFQTFLRVTIPLEPRRHRDRVHHRLPAREWQFRDAAPAWGRRAPNPAAPHLPAVYHQSRLPVRGCHEQRAARNRGGVPLPPAPSHQAQGSEGMNWLPYSVSSRLPKLSLVAYVVAFFIFLLGPIFIVVAISFHHHRVRGVSAQGVHLALVRALLRVRTVRQQLHRLGRAGRRHCGSRRLHRNSGCPCGGTRTRCRSPTLS